MPTRGKVLIALAGLAIAIAVYLRVNEPQPPAPPITFIAENPDHAVGESSGAIAPSPKPVRRIRPQPRIIDRAPAPVGSLSGTVLETPELSDRWFFDVMVGHLVAPGSESRAFSEGLAQLGYRLTAGSTFGIGLQARKLYEIAQSGESEVQLSDSVVSFDQNLSDDFLSAEWKAGLSTTIPLSQRSRDTKLYSRPMLTLEVSKSFAGEKLTVRAVPAVGFAINKFATDEGYQPLEQVVLAGLAEATVEILPAKLYLTGWGKALHHTFEQFDSSNNRPAPRNDFSYGTYLGYRVFDGFRAEAGFVFGNSLIQDVRYDVRFSDAPASRAFGAIRLAL